ncbi:hypothetical protein DM01DRAFT_1269520, partial [Hesseltinella vesiculosa]
VILDVAGLTTNCEDVKTFISNNPNLQPIIIDHIPFDNDVKVISRDQILNDADVLDMFNCR